MDLVVIMFLIFGVYFLQRNILVARLNSIDAKVNENFFDVLFGVHLLFWIVYLLYAYTTRSDSFEYYRRSSESESWAELWGTGTTFIRWFAYPFSNMMGLSFNSVMLIFSFLGFQGMLFFYLAARENLNGLPVSYYGFTLVELLFLLPNSHFWSASLGKGSLMTFAIGLTVFGLSRFNKRLLYIAIGAFLVYMIRPHILLAIILGVGIGVSFAQQGLKMIVRIPMIIIAVVGLTLISDDVMEFSNSDSLNVMNSDFIANRAVELSKGNSGVDISNYGQVVLDLTQLSSIRP